MSEFTCDSLLEWYHFLRQNVRELTDAHFESFTPTEREELRAELLEEIRKDYAFKLLALLEADVRQDFLVSLRRKRRDVVSKAYRDLCMAYRRETRQVAKRPSQACRRMPLERIFDKLRDCFSGSDAEFQRVCSATKGYFRFRNWYAHGRVRAMPVAPDPEDVYATYEQFQEKVLER